MTEEFEVPKKNLSFLEFGMGGKKIYIFKHHAVAVKCLKKAFDEKIIEKNNLLIHIDDHADLQFLEEHLGKSKEIIKMNTEELDNFVQNLYFDNSEFIVPLFYSGIIENSISVHRDEGNHDGKFVEFSLGENSEHLLFNQDGNSHKCFLGGTSLRNLFCSHEGILGDVCKNREVMNLYKNKDVILDIDLDYFTYSKGKRFAQNKRDIVDQINSNSFQDLINNSKIVLIALEPKYCGSEEDCLEILKAFQEELFSKYGLKVFDKVKEEFFDENSHI